MAIPNIEEINQLMSEVLKAGKVLIAPDTEKPHRVKSVTVELLGLEDPIATVFVPLEDYSLCLSVPDGDDVRVPLFACRPYVEKQKPTAERIKDEIVKNPKYSDQFSGNYIDIILSRDDTIDLIKSMEKLNLSVDLMAKIIIHLIEKSVYGHYADVWLKGNGFERV